MSYSNRPLLRRPASVVCQQMISPSKPLGQFEPNCTGMIIGSLPEVQTENCSKNWNLSRTMVAIQTPPPPPPPPHTHTHTHTKKKNFKNHLLVRNAWTDFNKIWQKCFYQYYSSNHDSSKTHDRQGRWGLFSRYIYIAKFLKSSCQKLLDRFQYNFPGMFPWWPSTKIVQAVMVCQKHGR